MRAACPVAGAGSADRGGDRGEVPGQAAAARWVAGGGLEQVVLDALLAKLAAGGLLKAGGNSAPTPPMWSPRWRR